MSREREEKAEKPFEACRLSPTHFTREKAVRENPEYTLETQYMLQLDGWKLVGWARANDVAPRDLCPYVLMLENEDGYQLWCHASVIILEWMAIKMGLE